MEFLKTGQVEAINVDKAGTMRVRWALAENVDAPNFYMRMIEVQPGGATEYHVHSWEHEVFVVSGQGAVKDNDGEQTAIVPGMFVYVAPEEKHQFINTGDNLLQFVCVIPRPQ